MPSTVRPNNVVVVPPRYHSESWSYQHRIVVMVVSDEASPEMVGIVDPYSDDDDDDEYGPWFNSVVVVNMVVRSVAAHWCTACMDTDKMKPSMVRCCKSSHPIHDWSTERRHQWTQ
jgi:hypothetical protein